MRTKAMPGVIAASTRARIRVIVHRWRKRCGWCAVVDDLGLSLFMAGLSNSFLGIGDFDVLPGRVVLLFYIRTRNLIGDSF